MTHTRHSEKVFNMKRLLLIIILTFSFQSLTKADDIRDFEIEGMSIGDSLLDHFSEKNIIKELNSKYVFKYKSDFIRIAAGSGEGFYLIKDTKQYDDIGITLKLNDKKFGFRKIHDRQELCDTLIITLKNRTTALKMQNYLEKFEIFTKIKFISIFIVN